MSIITQALKKAQHEQRHQPTPRAQYSSLTSLRPPVSSQPLSQRDVRRRSRQVVGLIVAGAGLLCGVGLVVYMSPSARDPLPVAMTVPVAPPASEATWPRSESPPTPSTQAPKRLRPAPLQPIVSPLRTPPTSVVTPPVRRTQPTPLAPPPAQPSAPSTPAQTAAVEADVNPAVQHAQAQQHFARGLDAYNAGAFDDAEAALQQALALDPTLKRAFNRLGNLYYQRDAYQQALAMYQRALALDPNYIEARNNLGNTYMQLEMGDKAITELNKAIAVDRESGLTYYNLACVYARTREPEKAIRYLEMAITREPEARHWAKTDTDFSAVRNITAFQKLLGTSS